MLHVVEISVKCPSCGIKFNSRQLPVLIDTGFRNSELRQDFKGKEEQMEHYAIATCPSCGRADWSNSFMPTDEPAALKQPNTPTHMQFRAAAIAAEKQGKDFYNIGLFYLHAAWCADDAKAEVQSREYRRLAAHAFTKSLIDASCPIANRAEIEYLIGELLRRAGDFQAAQDHFKIVMTRLPGRFAYMARKLMKLCASSNAQPIDFESTEGI